MTQAAPAKSETNGRPGVWISSAVRTPIGKLLGGLSPLSAPKLGALVVREAVERAAAPPDAVDEVILGNVLTAGLGQNPARQAAIGAGLPTGASALTINKVCGSGLKAVMLARQAILAGDADLVVAGRDGVHVERSASPFRNAVGVEDGRRQPRGLDGA